MLLKIKLLEFFKDLKEWEIIKIPNKILINNKKFPMLLSIFFN
tara:strand:- start:424 stop:552 length:129 start_codon:yes stop_codon:yes gene_type:complete